MRVLRSREVVPRKEHSIQQPLTPAKEEEVEPTNKSYETTPGLVVQTSQTLPISNSNQGQVGVGLRRSARLSSKRTSSSSYNVEEASTTRTRKRKPNTSSVVFDLELQFDVQQPSGGNNLNNQTELSLSLSDNKDIETTITTTDTEVQVVVVEPKTDNTNAWKRFTNKGPLVEEEEESPLENTTVAQQEEEEMDSDIRRNDAAIETDTAATLHITEKGKEKLLEVVGSSSNCTDMKSGVDNSVTQTVNVEQPPVPTSTGASTSARRDHMERFRNIARRNASRFAYFSAQQEEEEEEEDEVELPQMEASDDVEDWPGPFSTAMKIIKDRAANMASQQHNNIFTQDKIQSVPLTWVPKEKQQNHPPKKVPPSLQELCMTIIAENADAITSLENVPDVLRHKLTHLLCDSRKMNNHFFDLLAIGSPSEIRVKDCSWLSEEQFTNTFQRSDTSNLTVLQLDQCGRCLPDYVLFTTLAHLPSKLSALTNISLKGACRLSDAGLSALVASAPALRSINLGCCSLLTSDGIIDLADKLGPILKELYIDECFGIDAIRILPALLKLESLEVLSISRFETVNDSFIRQFVAVRGEKMKELVLADCTKLTDKSLKAIAESCPGLCAIDLTNLSKLTDTALGHLANGCQTIQTMKFCRNAFSDEAVAAYVETRGEPLKELSLNHVDEVGHHTALSLAKHATNLLSLDLSWCRNMTNEALGLIVDSCASLKMVKLFGCTQITNVFIDGHSNEEVRVTGLKGSQILKNIQVHDYSFPLRYSSL